MHSFILARFLAVQDKHIKRGVEVTGQQKATEGRGTREHIEREGQQCKGGQQICLILGSVIVTLEKSQHSVRFPYLHLDLRALAGRFSFLFLFYKLKKQANNWVLFNKLFL